MKELVVNKALNLVCKGKNFDEDKIIELKYGLEILYINLTKIIVVICLAIILKITKQVFLFFIFYAMLRTFGFGLHAKSSLACWLITIPTFVILPYVFSILRFSLITRLIIVIACFDNFVFCAPADTSKRPFVNKKKRISFKIVILLLTVFYCIYIVFGKNEIIINMLLLSLIVETLATNKFIYKLVKETYDNYKRYDRNVI